MVSTIYLDNATALLSPKEVITSLWRYYDTELGTASSPHDMGQKFHWAIKESYDSIKRSLELSEGASMVLTSSGAEATSQGILSLIRYGIHQSGKNHIAVASFHDAAARLASLAQEEEGLVSVSYIRATKKGILTKDTLIDAITPRTSVIVFPLVHPLLGTIQPLDELYEVAKSRDIPILLDISNAYGTIMVDLGQYKNMYYTIRGEAIGLPPGMGGILVRDEKAPPFSPLIYGDEHPFYCRGGPIHMAALVGMSEAMALLKSRDILYCTEVSRLKRLFEEKLVLSLGERSVIRPFFDNDAIAPHISCLIFKGVKNEALLYHLNKKQLYATIGGAGFQNLVDVFHGMGFEDCDQFSAISFALSSETKESEVLEAVERISTAYRLLSKISPYQKRVL